MNLQDKPRGSEHSPDDAKVLDKLEEMWDRKIMKGDDEFYESRMSSSSPRSKADLNERKEPAKERKRRGRKM